MTDNTERVNDFYTLLLTDFEAAAEKYLVDDVVWENPLPELVPFGGVYHGKEGLLDYLTQLASTIEMQPLHWIDIVGDGDVVAAIGIEENTLVKPTGKRYTMPCVHVLRFDAHGKVTHVREYNDIRGMLEAFTA